MKNITFVIRNQAILHLAERGSEFDSGSDDPPLARGEWGAGTMLPELSPTAISADN